MLADDHRMLREGLRRSMTEHGFDVVGEASDGAEAVDMAGELSPDVILMDVTMPELDGVEATRLVKAANPAIRVIMLTMHADQEVLAAAIRSGASGYLVKDCSTEEIADAIRSAVSGETTLSPALAASMLNEVRKLDAPEAAEAADRRRMLDPGGRRAALHLSEDGQEPPRIDLSEARREGPDTGCPPGRAHGHRLVGLTTQRGRNRPNVLFMFRTERPMVTATEGSGPPSMGYR
jgi:DNA-binding NarL/FixJ family response regulator